MMSLVDFADHSCDAVSTCDVLAMSLSLTSSLSRCQPRSSPSCRVLLVSVTPQFPVLPVQIPPLPSRNPSVKTKVTNQPQRAQSLLRTTLINE